MLDKIIKYFHHVLNPHCSECRNEREEKEVCRTCEILSQELAFAREEKRLLLDKIAGVANEAVTVNTENIKPIGSSYVPWRVRAQVMRENERHTMKLMEKVPKASNDDIAKLTVRMPEQSVEELEKELGIDLDNTEVSNASKIS